jgi:hypothetical protein
MVCGAVVVVPMTLPGGIEIHLRDCAVAVACVCGDREARWCGECGSFQGEAIATVGGTFDAFLTNTKEVINRTGLSDQFHIHTAGIDVQDQRSTCKAE